MDALPAYTEEGLSDTEMPPWGKENQITCRTSGEEAWAFV